MEEVAIPPYFICPISLQIMKDPVAATTGITYDRESIENWLLSSKDAIFCPLTKQPLTNLASELTPNHTLRRLIKSWLAENAVVPAADQIPSPTPLLDKTLLRKLLRDLAAANDERLRLDVLKNLLQALAMEVDVANCGHIVDGGVGVAKAMVLFVVRCYREGKVGGVEEALKILSHLSNTSYSIFETRVFEDVFDSFTWVLGLEMDNHMIIKSYAIEVLNKATSHVVAPSNVLSQIKLEFFKNITNLMREKISNSALKSILTILTNLCSWGRNRTKIVQVGAIFELITIELEKPEKNITELIFNLMAQLCSTADGRAELIRHAGGIAVVSKRILRISAATTDRAIQILSLIAKHAARKEVLLEMLRVGAVSKLCMVMQSNCEGYLKEKAREILRMHSNVWSNSPCIGVYVMTRDPRI